jgi:hypothetical protein
LTRIALPVRDLLPFSLRPAVVVVIIALFAIVFLLLLFFLVRLFSNQDVIGYRPIAGV